MPSGDFPRLAEYVARLPEGLRSFPECRAKASLLRALLEARGERPLTLSAHAPRELVDLVRHPPMPSDWISEVHYVAVHHLIATLGAADVLSRDLIASVVANEPERFLRLWAVMRPLYQDLATSASLKQIAALAGLSLRQLGRDLRDLTRTFGLFGTGFRDAMRVLRLRAAVLLLSAPDGSPSDVARTIGYGSLDAMGRAFRDAHLPAPSIVQEAVRYRDE